MQRVLSILVLFLIFHSSFTQTLTISNQTTLGLINDVFIYHENQINTAFTLSNGTADISTFPDTGIVILQHPSYLGKRLEMSKLVQLNYQIYLVERIVQFDDLTVTSNRWEQDKQEISQEITTIKAKTIAFRNPTTSADLLAQSGEVFVQKSQLGGGSPMLRGFSANSVLLVVDGVRLNNAIYRSGNLQNVINIDANSITNAEVIYGPGSVMYGSDAMGGVMDFHTQKLDFQSTGKPKVSAGAMGRYSSAANERTVNTNFSLLGKKLSFLGSLSRSQFGDLQSGSNRTQGYQGYFLREKYAEKIGSEDVLIDNNDPNLQVQSGFDLLNLTGKLAIKTGDQSELVYGAYYSTTSNIPRYDRLALKNENTDSLLYAEWYYGPQQWTMHNLSFTSYKNSRIYNQAKITAAYQNYEESRNDRRFGNSSLRSTQEEVDLYTLSIDFDKEFTNSSLFYGFDFFYNYVKSEAERKDIITAEISPTSTRYPSGGSQYYTSAAYANYVLRYNKSWTINLGARISNVQLNAKTDNSSAIGLVLDDLTISNTALNGMAGLIYRPNENSSWSALISSGFRAPNVDDVGKVFELDDEIVIIPNPDLKPEFAYNQELSYQFKNENLVLDLVAFHSLLTNAIMRGEYEINGSSLIEIDGSTRSIRAQINASQARIFGGSAKLSSQLNDFFGASGSISLTDGFIIGSLEPLRHIPPVFGRLSLIHQAGKLKSEIYSDFNFTKPASDIPASEIIDKSDLYTLGGSPGWVTLNLKAQYVLNENFTFQTGLENMLDQHYRPFSSGISAPGRNFIFTLRTKL